MIGRTDDGRLPTLRRVFYALFAPHGLLSRTLFKGQAAVDATAKLFKRKTSTEAASQHYMIEMSTADTKCTR
jgi:hypothetical protein